MPATNPSETLMRSMLINKGATPTKIKRMEKALDSALEAQFKMQGSGIQFSVLDLGHMMKFARKCFLEDGDSLELAMSTAIAKYRLN